MFHLQLFTVFEGGMVDASGMDDGFWLIPPVFCFVFCNEYSLGRGPWPRLCCGLFHLLLMVDGVISAAR